MGTSCLSAVEGGGGLEDNFSISTLTWKVMVLPSTTLHPFGDASYLRRQHDSATSTTGSSVMNIYNASDFSNVADAFSRPRNAVVRGRSWLCSVPRLSLCRRLG